MTVWERHLFKKEICYGIFEFVSTFCKKVFSGAPVKCVFLFGSKIADSVIFWNAAFGEIKDHSWEWQLFKKKVIMEVLSLSLPYKKEFKVNDNIL